LRQSARHHIAPRAPPVGEGFALPNPPASGRARCPAKGPPSWSGGFGVSLIAGPRAVRRPPVERKELARLLGHLGKVGSNINQLAYAYNRDRLLPGFAELVAMRREIGEMRAALIKALGHDN
jgi:hypothetical protein